MAALLLTCALLAGVPAAPADEQKAPTVAILIDDSLSMGHTDKYPDDKDIRKAVDQLAKAADLDAATRLRLAVALLTRKDPDWLDALARRGKVQLAIYHLSAEGRAAKLCDVADSRKADQLKEARQKIKDLRPKAEATRLGTAVREVIKDFRAQTLTALIVLTDGITTEGEDLSQASRHAVQAGVPLYFVGIGDAREAPDLALEDVAAPDAVLVNDTIVFLARLTGRGFKDLTVPVELREKGKDKVLASQNVSIDPEGRPQLVRLTYRPTEEGEKAYELRVPVQEGEANAENNVLPWTVEVVKPRTVKVLYVENEPRWEFRSVKALLERESARPKDDRTIDLRVRLLSAGEDWPAIDRSALAELPSKKELSDYDVVILGDVDPKDKREPKMAEFLKDLAEWVKERGGGLLMIAGSRHAPHAYKETPLHDILPIEVVAERQPAEPAGGLTESYRPRLTPVGRLSPIFRFSPDDKESDAAWDGLKKMYWRSEGYKARRTADVLATYPGRAEQPLVVRQFVGKGRSLFFGFDETWRWREDEPLYNQFWLRTVRSLSSRPGRTELRLDRRSPYRRGEPIKVTLRFPDDAPPPAEGVKVKVLVERQPPPSPKAPGEKETSQLELARVEGSRLTYEAVLTKTPPGSYRFWLVSPEVETKPRPRAECVVLPPPGEMDILRMNQAEMQRAAEVSGGRFYNLADAEKLLKDLPGAAK
jgi:uncharacterized membrane protein